MNDIKQRSRKVLDDYSCLRRYFSTRPLNQQGQMFLKLLEGIAQQILMGRSGVETYAASIEEDVEVLRAMISDSCEEIHEYFGVFGVAVAQINYGIEFCQKGIDALLKKEGRLISARGVGFDKSSPEHIQLQNYRMLLKRFSAEKERGVAPSYRPEAYAQFA